VCAATDIDDLIDTAPTRANRVFPFDAALEAFRYYETGNAFGKIVITQSEKGPAA
jgi:Zinc-binding dehydrogenase